MEIDFTSGKLPWEKTRHNLVTDVGCWLAPPRANQWNFEKCSSAAANVVSSKPNQQCVTYHTNQIRLLFSDRLFVAKIQAPVGFYASIWLIFPSSRTVINVPVFALLMHVQLLWTFAEALPYIIMISKNDVK